jgi:hypothetical protein
MSAISENDFLMANASPEMGVSFIMLSELGDKGEEVAH